MIYYHQLELDPVHSFLRDITKDAVQVGCEHIIVCQDDRPLSRRKYWAYLFSSFATSILSDDEREILSKYKTEEISVRILRIDASIFTPDRSREHITQCDPKVKIILDKAL